tara:strand:+ start:5327 stop:5671 length:345 start_codon:yes stop_codon:yes gene_type:complete
MSYHIHQGLNHVGSYQVSGIPFVYTATASTTPVTVQFPTVSKVVYIENLGGSHDLKVTFPSSPSSTITIPAGDKIEMTIKAGAVKVETASSTTNYQIYASLTSISRQRIEGIVI